MYTIKDTGNRETATSFAHAVQIIEQWYQDYAEWSTGSATSDENQAVWDAIDSVDQPEFGGDLQDYADEICQAVATAVGGTDFHGHGNYSVSAADQMGLYLTVEAADEDIADGVYFLHPDGSDWVAVQMNGGKIVGMTSGADAATHNAARDSWADVEPSDNDTEIEGDEAYTIVRLYAARIGLDIDADLVVVSKPAEKIEIEITFFDSDPSASSGSEFSSITVEVDSWDDAEDAVRAELLSQAKGLDADMGYEVGDTIRATYDDESGCLQEIRHTLTESDLGIADDETETTVCGHAVQYDKSGVGRCWVSINRDEIPASIVEELEGEMIDGGKDSCDSFRASNGIHYRW